MFPKNVSADILDLIDRVNNKELSDQQVKEFKDATFNVISCLERMIELEGKKNKKLIEIVTIDYCMGDERKELELTSKVLHTLNEELTLDEFTN